MRKPFWVFFIAFLAAIGGVLELSLQTAQSRSNGAQLNTSNCAGCHGGATGGAGTITGVPTTYVPGTSYPMTVAISGGPALRWGFRLTASDGFFTAGTGSQIPSATVITHTVAGTAQSSWTFNWTAPATAGATVSFAGGGLSANNNGDTTGDSPFDLPAASSQPGVTCSYALSAAAQNFTSAASTGSVNVSSGSGCAWTAASNVSWITVTSGSSGSGNGTVGYSVAANSVTSPRTGTLTIAGQTYTVTQDAAAATCTYTLSASSMNLTSAAGTGSVNVSSGSSCAWTAASNVSWITVTSGSSGSGNGTVGYSVAANSVTSPRTGTLTIAGQTYTVTQDAAAATCTYTLSASSMNFTSAAGTGSVNVSSGSGCTWTAASNVTWITVVSGSSGSGNGTVNYSVAANTGTSSRTGTITIAGQTYTVTQQAAGGTCTFTLSATAMSFSNSGGNGSINITSGTGCSWTAASNVSWITVTAGSNGSGNGSVSYTVEANADSASRTGTLTVAGQTFTVTEAGTSNAGFAIVSISPSSLKVNSDSFLLQVNGTNFVDGAQVLWNGTAKVTLLVDPTKLLAIIPERDLTTAGTISVTVQQGSETSNSVPFTIAAEASNQPALTSVMPNSGTFLGQTVVTLIGNGFLSGGKSGDDQEHGSSLTTSPSVGRSSDEEGSDHSDLKVYFGENQLAHVRVVSDTTLRGVTPAHAAGPVDVSAVFPNGQKITLPGGFTYVETETLPPPSSDSDIHELHIPYLVDSKQFRTNLGINNLDSSDANVTISLVDNQGQVIAQMQSLVPAQGMKQFDNVVRLLQKASDVTGREGYLLVKSASNIRAWASQIDNVTNDPSMEVGRSSGSSRVLIPSSVSNNNFKTSLMIVNASAAGGQITLEAHNTGGVMQGSPLTITLPPAGYAYLEDFYSTLGVANAFGPIYITANGGMQILATSRIYSDDSHTSGYLEGVSLDTAATRVYLASTLDTRDFRTNVGIVNVGSAPANVVLSLIGHDGVLLGTTQVSVPVGGMAQENGINRQIMGSQMASDLEGYLRLDSSQPIVAWTSQIDNRTQDPSLFTGKTVGATQLLIPSATNKGAFKSTLVVVNLDSSSSTSVEIKLRDTSGHLAATSTAIIPAGGFLSYSDILGQLGVKNTFGPLEISSLDGKQLLAISRVYSNIHTGGFFDGMN